MGHKTKSWQDHCTAICHTLYNRTSGAVSDNAMSTFTWYQMLHLVSDTAWKTIDYKEVAHKRSLKICSESKHFGLIRELENDVIRNMGKEYLVRGSRQQLEVIEGWWETRNQHRDVLENLKKGGIPDDNETLKYAYTIYRASLEIKDKKNACTIDMKAEIMVSLCCKAIALLINPTLALVIGAIWTAYDIMEYAFGRSEMAVVGPMIHVLNTRLILDANGVFIEDYY